MIKLPGNPWVFRRIFGFPKGGKRQGYGHSRSQFIPTGWAVAIALVLVFATFVGMRGRLSKKSPIRVGTAYYCGNAFLNQLGLNPVFTFIKSIE